MHIIGSARTNLISCRLVYGMGDYDINCKILVSIQQVGGYQGFPPPSACNGFFTTSNMQKQPLATAYLHPSHLKPLPAFLAEEPTAAAGRVGGGWGGWRGVGRVGPMGRAAVAPFS